MNTISMCRKKISELLILFLFLTTASPVLAQGDADPFADSGSSSNPASFTDGLNAVSNIAGDNQLAQAQSSQDILQTIIRWFLSIIGTIALISLLYGGYLYITSQGDENQVSKAKMLILYSVLGIIVIGLSAIIVNVVINLVGQGQ